jgi:hypothetical protein
LVKWGSEAYMRQRSAKRSLGLPECRLPTPRDGWLALAAKGGFPPSIPDAAFLIEVWCGLTADIRSVVYPRITSISHAFAN